LKRWRPEQARRVAGQRLDSFFYRRACEGLSRNTERPDLLVRRLLICTFFNFGTVTVYAIFVRVHVLCRLCKFRNLV
jgi:hypothetical protein